jgi:hypothetical protein
MVPVWVACWDRLVPEKVGEDEAQVTCAEQLEQELLEQRHAGEVIRCNVPQLRDKTPAEVREARAEAEERLRRQKERGCI